MKEENTTTTHSNLTIGSGRGELQVPALLPKTKPKRKKKSMRQGTTAIKGTNAKSALMPEQKKVRNKKTNITPAKKKRK